MGKIFSFPQKVMFKHCDPAGIVFFPRYFEMMNDCIEVFFDQVVGVPFETLHVSHGVPTAEIQTRFCAPSRHGETLELRLKTTQLGRTSWSYEMTGLCGVEERFTTKATLVHINVEGQPCRWPDALRDKLSEYEVSDEP